MPQLAGGGGAGDEDCCGDGLPGGGVIELIAGEVILEGEIRARGVNGGSNRPAGAGGSVLIDATRFSGSGSIDASGGRSDANGEPTGPGGGGRVALYADELVGFDPATQIAVRGGRRLNGSNVSGYASPGTVFVHHGASQYGDLVIDNGENADGNDRPSASTILPTLGSGNVTDLMPLGGRRPVDHRRRSTPALAGCLRAPLRSRRAGPRRLPGSQPRVSSSQALLEGAGAIADAATFAGEYRFDRVELLNGAGLRTDDPVEGMDLEIGPGDAELPASFMFTDLTLRTGRPEWSPRKEVFCAAWSPHSDHRDRRSFDVTGQGFSRWRARSARRRTGGHHSLNCRCRWEPWRPRHSCQCRFGRRGLRQCLHASACRRWREPETRIVVVRADPEVA